MEYAEAKNIRAKSFGTMLGEHEGGLGASLKATISQKSQARMTGIKEKFDPMNIAKFVTGGSNWAPAMLGKLTGRKQSSIDYFSGVKRRKGTAEKLGDVGPGGGDFLGILQSIESLLHTTREEDKLKAEQENNFAEEKALEKARRHKELMEALTGKPYKEKVVPTATKEEEKGFLENIIDFLSNLKFLASIASRIPLLAFLLGLYNAKILLDEIEYGDKMAKNEAKISDKAFREKQTDFSGLKITQDEAKEILEQDEVPAKTRDVDSFGGIERIQAIADGKPDPGGIAPKQKTYEEHRQDLLPATVAPRPVGDSGKIKAKQMDWDKRNSKDYNDDGTRKTATPVNTVEDSQVKKQSEASGNEQTNVPTVVSESPNPVTETPIASQKLESVQAENLNSKIQEKTAVGKTVVNNAVIKSAMESMIIDGPLLSVRNMEESYQDMIFNSTRIV
jgi:hypothetical protein